MILKSFSVSLDLVRILLPEEKLVQVLYSRLVVLRKQLHSIQQKRLFSLPLLEILRMPSVLVILDLEVLLRSKEQQLQKELQYLQMIYRYYLPLRDLLQILLPEVKLVRVLYSDLLVVMSLDLSIMLLRLDYLLLLDGDLRHSPERTMLDLLSL